MKIFNVDSENNFLIQYAVEVALRFGIHPKELHSHIIIRYWEHYKATGEYVYLKFAVDHILVYLKSNFDYSNNISLFTDIVKKDGYSSFEDFLRYTDVTKSTNLVKLTSNRISAIIGHGIYPLGNRRILIKDIIRKVKNREYGIYNYTVYLSNIPRTAFLIIDDHGVYMRNSQGIDYEFDLSANHKNKERDK